MLKELIEKYFGRICFYWQLFTESVGDYASGTNHTLPTNGYAACIAVFQLIVL
jgi:histidinol dehydrogenase